MSHEEDYLSGWPRTCAGCGESCVGLTGVVKVGEIDDSHDTRHVMHGACYRKLLGTFADFKRQQGILCAECRKPCDGHVEVVELLLGNVMHMACYEDILQAQQDELEGRESYHRRRKPAARLPGEEALSPAQVRKRRYRQLLGLNVSQQVLEPGAIRKRKKRMS